MNWKTVLPEHYPSQYTEINMCYTAYVMHQWQNIIRE